eukprot:scaffold447_cov307-Pinguiococcus_pyrenoidosus.AAC.61
MPSVTFAPPWPARLANALPRDAAHRLSGVCEGPQVFQLEEQLDDLVAALIVRDSLVVTKLVNALCELLRHVAELGATLRSREEGVRQGALQDPQHLPASLLNHFRHLPNDGSVAENPHVVPSRGMSLLRPVDAHDLGWEPSLPDAPDGPVRAAFLQPSGEHERSNWDVLLRVRQGLLRTGVALRVARDNRNGVPRADLCNGVRPLQSVLLDVDISVARLDWVDAVFAVQKLHDAPLRVPHGVVVGHPQLLHELNQASLQVPGPGRLHRGVHQPFAAGHAVEVVLRGANPSEEAIRNEATSPRRGFVDGEGGQSLAAAHERHAPPFERLLAQRAADLRQVDRGPLGARHHHQRKAVRGEGDVQIRQARLQQVAVHGGESGDHVAVDLCPSLSGILTDEGLDLRPKDLMLETRSAIAAIGLPVSFISFLLQLLNLSAAFLQHEIPHGPPSELATGIDDPTPRLIGIR